MIILGIDPGTTKVGYAMLEIGSATPRLLKAGLIGIRSDSVEQRLKDIYRGVTKLIRMWRPEALALERLFFAKNQKTAFAVAEARGVILLITALERIRVYEYTPLEVKKSITGDGSADKAQVKKLVELTLGVKTRLAAEDDVFDAIAVALTCNLKGFGPKSRAELR